MPLDAVSKWLQQNYPATAAPAAQPVFVPPAQRSSPAALLPQDQWQGNARLPRLVPLQVLLYPQTNIQVEPGVRPATQKALASVPGTAWAGSFASNGNRETAILMPAGFDPRLPTEVIYYFHGHNNQIAGVLTDKNHGLASQIQELGKSRNVILVIPQGPPKERDSTWMNPRFKESLASFQQDVNRQIEKLAPGVQIRQVTLKGHSAGGLPLLNGVTAGGIRADRIDFLDASYGYWASETAAQLKKQGLHPLINVTYIPGTGTEDDARRLRGVAGVTVRTTAVGHSDVPKTFLAK